jgi:hypothetical protein
MNIALAILIAALFCAWCGWQAHLDKTETE